MSTTTRTERIITDDGAFDAHVVLPASGTGPGFVLVQEIFGVGAYVKDVAERLAEAGYVVLAPDLYWRVAPGVALDHDEAGLGRGLDLVQRLDVPLAVADCVAALAHLRRLPEVRDGVGVIGFCLGGTLAWLVGAEADPDVVVSYYGSGVPSTLDAADRITCPVLLHFGGQDSYIPADQVAQVQDGLADRSDMEVHVQHDAGHAFDNHRAPMFHHAEAADRAWRITLSFLERSLPVTVAS